jgi:hypothetical protein
MNQSRVNGRSDLEVSRIRAGYIPNIQLVELSAYDK